MVGLVVVVAVTVGQVEVVIVGPVVAVVGSLFVDVVGVVVVVCGSASRSSGNYCTCRFGSTSRSSRRSSSSSSRFGFRRSSSSGSRKSTPLNGSLEEGSRVLLHSPRTASSNREVRQATVLRSQQTTASQRPVVFFNAKVER